MAEVHSILSSLAHSDDHREAAQSVANVVRFMAGAINDRTEALDQQERDGVRLILETCAETLERHLAKGVAA